VLRAYGDVDGMGSNHHAIGSSAFSYEPYNNALASDLSSVTAAAAGGALRSNAWWGDPFIVNNTKAQVVPPLRNMPIGRSLVESDTDQDDADDEDHGPIVELSTATIGGIRDREEVNE
jgi:hypothetical protein